ncbi:unnamed protein product [Cylicostephanus goldi]|uniref:Uncharacterized protein n=1 Tax=Cylicostephanus goldi TaxID=71465 RepID=A0A3P6SAN8_CYLGO|nr:unnamed protein product [Cylicostephanus goldi]
MVLYVLFLLLTALFSRGVGNFIDCYDELRERQLDEKYRDILIAALRADNAWMSYNCTFEKYARLELRNKRFRVPPDVNFTIRYMRDRVESVERFLRDGVEKFRLRKKKVTFRKR